MPDLAPGVAVRPPQPGAAPSARPGAAPTGAPTTPPGTPAPSAGVIDDGRFHAVIAKAMQPAIAAMLPVGEPNLLPGGAVIDQVAIAHDSITVHIRLTDGNKVRYRMTQRLLRPEPGKSRKFEINGMDGAANAPAGTQAALNKLVIAREPSFEWQEVRAKPTMTGADPALAGALAEVDSLLAEGKEQAASLRAAELMVPHRPHSLSVMPAWNVAVRLRRVGRTEEALAYVDRVIKAFEQMHALGPVPRPAWQRYAGALQIRGRAAQAKKAVADCVLATGGGQAECGLTHIAEVAALDGKLDGAATLLDTALARPDAKDLRLLLDRVGLARRLGKRAEALKWAEKAVEVAPRSNDALAALASALTDAGKPALAVARWLELFDRHPEHKSLFSGLADAIGRLRSAELMDTANEPAAAALAVDLSAKAGKSDAAAFGLAALRYHRGDFGAAISALRPLLQVHPEETRIHTLLALSAHWLSHAEVAQRHADLAVTLGPSDADALLCRSVVRRPQDLPGAAADLRRHIGLLAAAGADMKGPGVAELRADLAALDAGEVPPERQRPTSGQTLFGKGGMPAPWLVLLAVGLVAIGGLFWQRRGRKAAASDPP